MISLELSKEVGSILYCAKYLNLRENDLINKCLKQYLDFRPNLKTRTDYKMMFVRNSVLVDTIIKGLIKAGWKPED